MAKDRLSDNERKAVEADALKIRADHRLPAIAGFVRRIHQRYREDWGYATLLRIRADVAEHKGWTVHRAGALSFTEFNAALDELAGQPRFGVDADQYILNWDGEAYSISPMRWQLLRMIWGRYNVSFADVGEEVWGSDIKHAHTIRTFVSRLDDFFSDNQMNLQLSCRGQQISPDYDWPI